MSVATLIKNKLLRSSHNFLSLRQESKYHFLFITTDNLICRGQIYPFYRYKKELFENSGATFSEVSIDDYIRSGWHSNRKPDLIFFQPWFNNSIEYLKNALGRAKLDFPSSKIAFLDSFAPLDFRFAEAVNPMIDVYIKKHTFRDPSENSRSTLGDTNLVDYYGKLYKIYYPEMTYSIPSDFLEKLVIGTGFEASQRILPFVQKSTPPLTMQRAIDIHARLGGAGSGWYGCMRKQAIETVNALQGLNIQIGADVKYKQYIKEMRNAKLCFSPFGFGEVCWRDFEAMMCGSLLIKPDMRHVKTRSNVFREYETYVPIKWDFSDLEEKVHFYLENGTKRNEIIRNAYLALHMSAGPGQFISFVDAVISKAKLC